MKYPRRLVVCFAAAALQACTSFSNVNTQDCTVSEGWRSDIGLGQSVTTRFDDTGTCPEASAIVSSAVRGDAGLTAVGIEQFDNADPEVQKLAMQIAPQRLSLDNTLAKYLRAFRRGAVETMDDIKSELYGYLRGDEAKSAPSSNNLSP